MPGLSAASIRPCKRRRSGTDENHAPGLGQEAAGGGRQSHASEMLSRYLVATDRSPDDWHDADDPMRGARKLFQTVAAWADSHGGFDVGKFNCKAVATWLKKRACKTLAAPACDAKTIQKRATEKTGPPATKTGIAETQAVIDVRRRGIDRTGTGTGRETGIGIGTRIGIGIRREAAMKEGGASVAAEAGAEMEIHAEITVRREEKAPLCQELAP